MVLAAAAPGDGKRAARWFPVGPAKAELDGAGLGWAAAHLGCGLDGSWDWSHGWSRAWCPHSRFISRSKGGPTRVPEAYEYFKRLRKKKYNQTPRRAEEMGRGH